MWLSVFEFSAIFQNYLTKYPGGIRSHDPQLQSPWWQVETIPFDHAAMAVSRIIVFSIWHVGYIEDFSLFGRKVIWIKYFYGREA
jgi:hypothetical protein